MFDSDGDDDESVGRFGWFLRGLLVLVLVVVGVQSALTVTGNL